MRVEVVDPGSTAIPPCLLPAGLSAHNAELGCAAAQRLLAVTGRRTRPSGARLAAVLGSVRLPGRLSRHQLPGSRTELIVDAAINRAGIAAALAVAAQWWTRIDHVLVCLPDHKDVQGAISELAGLPVTFVRLPDEHLRFAHALPAGWTVIDAAQLTRELRGRSRPPGHRARHCAISPGGCSTSRTPTPSGSSAAELAARRVGPASGG